MKEREREREEPNNLYRQIFRSFFSFFSSFLLLKALFLLKVTVAALENFESNLLLSLQRSSGFGFISEIFQSLSISFLLFLESEISLRQNQRTTLVVLIFGGAHSCYAIYLIELSSILLCLLEGLGGSSLLSGHVNICYCCCCCCFVKMM
jgi:hypothetical protein